MRDALANGRGASIVALVALAVALAALPGTAAAQPVGDVVVGEDETVRGDLTSHAGTVVVKGTVEGDVTSHAGSVVVTGEVTGDVKSTAGSVTVSGVVGDDVTAQAGGVDVQSGALVGDDVEATAGDVTVAEGATVEGDATALAGDLGIDGTVAGDATTGETLRLGETATVGGDATYGESLDRAEGATVAGSLSEGESAGLTGFAVSLPDLPTLPPALDGAYWALAGLVLGALLLLVLPAFSAEVAETALGEPLRSGGAGALTLLVVPSVLVALLLSVVGIPVALGGGVAFWLAAWGALVYGEYVVGRWALEQVDADSRWAALAVGVLGVELLGRVPVAGGVLKFAVLALGLGAVAIAVADRVTGDGNDAGPRDPDGPVPEPGSAA